MSSSPKFFRTVLQRNLDVPKLVKMIPKKFVEDYGKVLSNSVNLKLSDGRLWQVGLRTAMNGAVGLEKGWDKFSEHYCLEFGSLLIFKLLDGRRSSNFEVTIFDPTGVETKYFSSSTQFKEDSDSDSDTDSDSHFDESSESFRGHSKERKNVSVPCIQSRRKMRKDDSFTIKTEPAEEEEGKECNYILREIPSRKKRVIPKHEVKVSRKKQQSPKKVETTQTFSSKSDHKPSFKVVMRPNNVQGRFILHIPTRFAKKYFSPKMRSASLQVGNKQWNVALKQYEGHARFSAGWGTFLVENGLEDGDTCLFELVSTKPCVFKVSTFRKVSTSVSMD